jgi:hypothetical protein
MMKNKKIKIMVDVFMVIFLGLSFVRWEGGPIFHFTVGIICVLFFMTHVYIHRKWLKTVTESFLAGRTTNKTIKRKYVINILLLTVWSITILTGIFAIGPYMSGIEKSVFGRLHGVFARLGLLLVVFHVIQHRTQIISYFKKIRLFSTER